MTKIFTLLLIICLIISFAETKAKKKQLTEEEKKLKRELDENERQQTLKLLQRQKCKTADRYIQANCACIDGFYDDGVNDECQICPYPCLTCHNDSTFCQTCQKRPFISLQHLVSEEKLAKFQDYVYNGLNIFNEEGRVQKALHFRPNHGKAVWLYNKVNWKKTYGFKHERSYRHSDFYYRGNYTEIKEFVKSLDIFEYTGMQFVIFNSPGEKGSEHIDHSYKDIISEFIWLSGNTAKQFYVKDKFNGSRRVLTSNIGYFDDQQRHSIAPSDREQWSFRVDGKFKPWVRQYILDNFDFPSQSRREVFRKNLIKLHRCPEHPKPCAEYSPNPQEKQQPEKAQYQ